MKLMIIVPIMCILFAGYIDANTYETELKSQNIGNYSAFEAIEPEDEHLEKIKYEIKMKEMQNLIDNTK